MNDLLIISSVLILFCIIIINILLYHKRKISNLLMLHNKEVLHCQTLIKEFIDKADIADQKLQKAERSLLYFYQDSDDFNKKIDVFIGKILKEKK